MTSASKTLFKSSTARLILLVTSIVIGFLMMPFLVHSLGDKSYGVWALVSAIVSFYNLMDAGIGQSLQRFLVQAIHGKEKGEACTALSTSIVMSSLVGVLILIVTLGITQLAPVLIDSEPHRELFQITLIIVGAKAALQLPMFPYFGLLVAQYRYDIIAYIHLASLLIRTLIIVIVVKMGYGVIAVAAVSTITTIVDTLIIIGIAKRYDHNVRFSLSSFSFEHLRTYFHYGKFVFLIEMADKIQQSLDDVVVSMLIGIAAVTHYTIALTLVLYFSTAIEMIFGVISPLLNKYYKLKQWDNIREVFLITTEITVTASVLVGGLIILLGKPFIIFWVGEDYTHIYPALVILTTGAIFAKALTPGIFTLLAIAKHKFYGWIALAGATVNLLLSIVLAQYIGITGVALGTLLPSLVITLLILPRYICKQIELPAWSYYRILLRTTGTGALILIPAYFLCRDFELSNLPALVVTGLIVSLVYTVVALRFVLSRNTTHYIADSVPERFTPVIRFLTA